MKAGDIVRIKDSSNNKKEHRGLICLVLKVEKSYYFGNYEGLVCVIQSNRKRLRYHEGRLEVVNAIYWKRGRG